MRLIHLQRGMALCATVLFMTCVTGVSAQEAASKVESAAIGPSSADELALDQSRVIGAVLDHQDPNMLAHTNFMVPIC